MSFGNKFDNFFVNFSLMLATCAALLVLSDVTINIIGAINGKDSATVGISSTNTTPSTDTAPPSLSGVEFNGTFYPVENGEILIEGLPAGIYNGFTRLVYESTTSDGDNKAAMGILSKFSVSEINATINSAKIKPPVHLVAFTIAATSLILIMMVRLKMLIFCESEDEE